ncbi:MAG: hypothetical protein M3Z29_01480, partial [Pseudomonadota bacterium]|nr:hypothetical protein [Pseudomonadota bacterium]
MNPAGGRGDESPNAPQDEVGVDSPLPLPLPLPQPQPLPQKPARRSAGREVQADQLAQVLARVDDQ